MCIHFQPPSESDTTPTATVAAVFPDNDEPSDLSYLPPEYHKFTDIFSKTKARTLPLHQTYDHKIELEDGKTPPFSPLYSLLKAKYKVLEQFVMENLQSGFICSLNSPAGAPICHRHSRLARLSLDSFFIFAKSNSSQPLVDLIFLLILSIHVVEFCLV